MTQHSVSSCTLRCTAGVLHACCAGGLELPSAAPAHGAAPGCYGNRRGMCSVVQLLRTLVFGYIDLGGVVMQCQALRSSVQFLASVWVASVAG